MKFNKHAFTSSEDRRYANWDGNTQVLTYEFIQTVKDLIDLDSIDTIFDIGSRDSCQSRELSDWFPESKIYLFEPVPTSFQWCVDHTKTFPNIVCNKVALSNFVGKSSFFEVINGNIGASSLHKAVDGNAYNLIQREVKVDVTTGEEFMNSNQIHSLDLIWADVQGSELECFMGFGDHINNVKAIHTEVAYNSYYHNGTNLTELSTFMSDSGFEQLRIIENPVGIEVDVVYINKRFIKR